MVDSDRNDDFLSQLVLAGDTALVVESAEQPQYLAVEFGKNEGFGGRSLKRMLRSWRLSVVSNLRVFVSVMRELHKMMWNVSE